MRQTAADDDEQVSVKKTVRKEMEFDDADLGGYGYDFAIPDIDYSDGPSGSLGGSEEPERIRAGSEERRVSKDSQGLNNKSRPSVSSDGMSLPSFDMDSQGSPLASSDRSGSRLPSIGEVHDHPLALPDDGDDAPFKDASLKEEPESYQTYSQLPISQVMTFLPLHFSEQIHEKAPVAFPYFRVVARIFVYDNLLILDA